MYLIHNVHHVLKLGEVLQEVTRDADIPNITEHLLEEGRDLVQALGPIEKVRIAQFIRPVGANTVDESPPEVVRAISMLVVVKCLTETGPGEGLAWFIAIKANPTRLQN